MAKRHYTADSPILLPSSPMCVRSNVTGGYPIVTGATADAIVLSIIAPSIG